MGIEGTGTGRIVCDWQVTLRAFCLKALEVQAISGEGILFVFTEEGGGEWCEGIQARSIGPGEVLVVNAASKGRLKAANGSPFRFLYFSLGVEHLWALCPTNQLCSLQALMDRLKNPSVYSASTAIASECHELLRKVPKEANLEHRSLLFSIAAMVLSAEFRDTSLARSGSSGAEEHFLELLGRVSVRELMDLPSDELARKFHCSRRQLNRLFQRCFGRSAGALKMEMRLLRAAALLGDPDAKVINVAEQCGFNHLGLFNSCFKRRFSVCPSKWRRKLPDFRRESRESLAGHPGCQLRAQGLCAWAEKDEECPAAGSADAVSGKPPRGLQTFVNTVLRESEAVARGLMSGSRPSEKHDLLIGKFPPAVTVDPPRVKLRVAV